MANIELDQGMKNHPGFMPFTHCNTSTTNDDDAKKDEKKDTSSEGKE